MIVNTASITSLVRMTLYHQAINVCHPKVATNEGMAALGGKARSAAAEDPVTQLVSDLSGVRTVKNQTAVEAAKTKSYRVSQVSLPWRQENASSLVKGGGNVRCTALHHTALPHDLITMSSRV